MNKVPHRSEPNQVIGQLPGAEAGEDAFATIERFLWLREFRDPEEDLEPPPGLRILGPDEVVAWSERPYTWPQPDWDVE